jgi:hypothetical protein
MEEWTMTMTAENTNEQKRDHTTRKLCIQAINSRPDRDFGYDDLCLALGGDLGGERNVAVKLARAAANGEIRRTGRSRDAALSFTPTNTRPAPRVLKAAAPPSRPAGNTALDLLYAKRAELRAELSGIDTAIKALGGERG